MPIVKFWTPDKLEELKKEYATSDNLQLLADKFGCTIKALQTQASKHGFVKNHIGQWSKDELEYLRKNFAKTSNEELSDHLQKSESAIRTYAQKLKLKKANNYWKPKQEVYLMENYGNLPIAEIQKHLGKTKWGVINKYRELKGKRKTGDKTIESNVSKEGLAN